MSQSKLIELSYFDPAAAIRLTAYADTVVLDRNGGDSVISAIRFGGYPEMVHAMSDAIYGGATVEAVQNTKTRQLKSLVKGYRRQLSHDGTYAVATLMADNDAQEADTDEDESERAEDPDAVQKPRKCYIFCPAGDRERLFFELDQKTAAPLISEFRDYVLDSLIARGGLRQLKVISLRQQMDAWVLELKQDDENVVQILEEGLRDGRIAIPGAVPGNADGFEDVTGITDYLNTFGVTVADRIRNQFQPLFDPAKEPLSEETTVTIKEQSVSHRRSLYEGLMENQWRSSGKGNQNTRWTKGSSRSLTTLRNRRDNMKVKVSRGHSCP